MAIEIGNKISESLKDYITTFTTPDERRSIRRKKYTLSDEMLYKVLNGDRNVSEKEIPVLYEFLKLSIKNRAKRIKTLNEVHNEIKYLFK